jgi:hypothetical protein
LRTSFRALSITRIEIKESMIYTAERDYLKLECDTAKKQGNGAPKPPGLSAEPAHRTCEQ